MEIKIVEEDSKGFAKALDGPKRVGTMSYSLAGKNIIIIDHTDVDLQYSGKGIGKQMLYKIVEKAREDNKKIIPLCPFAAAMFKKTEHIQDVLN